MLLCEVGCSLCSDVRNGNHTELGWPQTAYGVSKVGVTLMTPIQQRVLDADASKPDVVVNAVSWHSDFIPVCTVFLVMTS